jgi:hypothetical protein
VTFEIWTRHGEEQDYRAKDPRREAPDFSATVSPRSVMWASSRLPEIDLTEHGLSEAAARHAAFRVVTEGDEPIYANRADENGVITDMPCPSVEPGKKVELEAGDQTFAVQTV